MPKAKLIQTIRNVTVTDKEAEWVYSRSRSKINQLFSIAVNKVFHIVDHPDTVFSDDWSMSVTLNLKKIEKKANIRGYNGVIYYFPFRIVIRNDNQSRIRFVNLEEAEAYIKKNYQEALKCRI